MLIKFVYKSVVTHCDLYDFEDQSRFILVRLFIRKFTRSGARVGYFSEMAICVANCVNAHMHECFYE